MKKTTKKLTLRSQTIRALEQPDLVAIHGGEGELTGACPPMSGCAACRTRSFFCPTNQR